MTSLSDVQSPSPRPVRDGLFQFDPPQLLGSRCSACGTAAFPARDFCPKCAADGPHQAVALSPRGTVFSYTVVHQAPAGRPTPYVLAYVDLPDQVRVMAQVDAPPGVMRIGMPVRLVLKPVGEDGGVPVIGYAFAADADLQEVQ